jgi:hypothetical protein
MSEGIEPLLVKKAEAAKLLSMATSTLEKITARREIPIVKVDGRIYYDVLDLQRWIESKKILPSGS